VVTPTANPALNIRPQLPDFHAFPVSSFSADIVREAGNRWMQNMNAVNMLGPFPTLSTLMSLHDEMYQTLIPHPFFHITMITTNDQNLQGGKTWELN